MFSSNFVCASECAKLEPQGDGHGWTLVDGYEIGKRGATSLSVRRYDTTGKWSADRLGAVRPKKKMTQRGGLP